MKSHTNTAICCYRCLLKPKLIANVCCSAPDLKVWWRTQSVTATNCSKYERYQGTRLPHEIFCLCRVFAERCNWTGRRRPATACEVNAMGYILRCGVSRTT